MHIQGQHKEVISAVNVVEGTFYVASYVFLFFVLIIINDHFPFNMILKVRNLTWKNRFHKKDIQKLSHAILRIFLLRRFALHHFFFKSDGIDESMFSTPHLFSYNEAFGQVTLVLDAETLRYTILIFLYFYTFCKNISQ